MICPNTNIMISLQNKTSHHNISLALNYYTNTSLFSVAAPATSEWVLNSKVIAAKVSNAFYSI